MKTNESFNRAAQDAADSEAFKYSGLSQLVTEIPCDATHTRDGHFRMAIGADIIAEEIPEIINYDLLHIII